MSQVALHALAILIPWIRASYSAALLDAFFQFILSTYIMLSPLGDVNMTPVLAPSFRFDPSKYMVQLFDICGFFWLLQLEPLCVEVREHLRLDSFEPLISDVTRVQLDPPLGDFARGVIVVQYLR